MRQDLRELLKIFSLALRQVRQWYYYSNTFIKWDYETYKFNIFKFIYEMDDCKWKLKCHNIYNCFLSMKWKCFVGFCGENVSLGIMLEELASYWIMMIKSNKARGVNWGSWLFFICLHLRDTLKSHKLLKYGQSW